MCVSCRWKESRVGGGDNVRWEGVRNGMVEGRNENLYGSLDELSGIHLHVWNPRVCLVGGISPVHHIESHVIATYSEGLLAEMARHLTNTASIVPEIAHIPCSTSLYHFHFFDVIGCIWAPNRGGILQVGSDQ